MRYRDTYGYPWRWAILAELFWRIEQCPWRPLRVWAYPKRKWCEHHGIWR